VVLVVVAVVDADDDVVDVELDEEEPQPAATSARDKAAAGRIVRKRGSVIASPGIVTGVSRTRTPPAPIASRRNSTHPCRGTILAAVHFAQLTPPEQRVLGCLIEKRWTTPEQYPLSLNALRLACNQSTNRDPVTHYDETTVRDAAQRLSRYGLARLASGHSSRAIKYRHLAEEALGLGREELAVLAVLLLRGPQTPGELKARSERMARLDSLADVERVLGTLADRGYARRLERRPGQKEDRFEQLFGGGEGEAPAAPSYPTGPPAAVAGAPAADAVGAPPGAVFGAPAAGVPGAPAGTSTMPRASNGADLAERVAALEAEVASLRAEVSALRDP
jgi:uncharacterized protein YceH (UPF0502 family)